MNERADSDKMGGRREGGRGALEIEAGLYARPRSEG